MTRSALMLCALILSGTALAAGRPDTTGTVVLPGTFRHDLWFGKDKADHLVVSAFAVGLGYYAARKELHLSDPGSKNSGAVFSLSLGLLKELRDRRRKGNFFSLKDLTADVIGIGVGYLCCTIGER